jgi:hypothetical protein
MVITNKHVVHGMQQVRVFNIDHEQLEHFEIVEAESKDIAAILLKRKRPANSS